MKSRLIQIFIATFVIISIFACGDITKDKVKFRVVSYNGSFTGSFSVDGDTPVSFPGTPFENDAYIFEHRSEIKNQIEIEASPKNAGTSNAPTSLEIKVYNNNELVKSAISTVEKDTVVKTISLVYEKGETQTTTQ